MWNDETDPVRRHSPTAVLNSIDESLEDRIRRYATQSQGAISLRIAELEMEWEIERWFESGMAVLGLTGLVLGVARNKKWLWLAGGSLAALADRGCRGWTPLLGCFRQAGLRSRREIERERFALKILRGDFEAVPTPNPSNHLLRARDVARAVRA